jgi:phosphoglycerate dehydrogenase-like enzyme
VTTTPGLNDESCADHALAMLLAASRRIVEHDASVRGGAWDRGGNLTPWDLHKKRVAVIGYGRIGKAVVRRLEGFGTEIQVLDPVADVPERYRCASLSELLTWADVVTLHIPFTASTAGLIGADQISLMKPGSILINTSRGGLVDEQALYKALTEGTLRAAALDVFDTEPPGDTPLKKLPNVVLSPHIAGLSREAIEAMTRQCVQQILDVFAGKVPAGAVNPEALGLLSQPENGRSH